MNQQGETASIKQVLSFTLSENKTRNRVMVQSKKDPMASNSRLAGCQLLELAHALVPKHRKVDPPTNDVTSFQQLYSTIKFGKMKCIKTVPRLGFAAYID